MYSSKIRTRSVVQSQLCHAFTSVLSRTANTSWWVRRRTRKAANCNVVRTISSFWKLFFFFWYFLLFIEIALLGGGSKVFSLFRLWGERSMNVVVKVAGTHSLDCYWDLSLHIWLFWIWIWPLYRIESRLLLSRLRPPENSTEEALLILRIECGASSSSSFSFLLSVSSR